MSVMCNKSYETGVNGLGVVEVRLLFCSLTTRFCKPTNAKIYDITGCNFDMGLYWTCKKGKKIVTSVGGQFYNLFAE
jgi:hypothetical protein